MHYEDLLRRSETALGSIVGVNGGIDAVRRSLFLRMDDGQLPDFVLPLHVVREGFRVVYESDALLSEDSLTTSRAEYKMRVRVAVRAWWTLVEMSALFNPFQYGLYSLQLFSHKALRYLAFVALPVLYVSSLALASSGIVYATAFAAASIFIAAGALGYALDYIGRSNRITSLPYYFILINVAAGPALLHFLRGRRQAVWTPRLG